MVIFAIFDWNHEAQMMFSIFLIEKTPIVTFLMVISPIHFKVSPTIIVSVYFDYDLRLLLFTWIPNDCIESEKGII